MPNSQKLEYQVFLKNHDQKISNLIFGNNMLKSIAKTPSNIPNASLRSELKNQQKIIFILGAGKNNYFEQNLAQKPLIFDRMSLKNHELACFDR